MSNHSGSYMLNEVLLLLKNQYNFFENMDQESRKKFIIKILNIGDDSDCNPGEILDALGKSLEFCYCCNESTKNFDEDNDICKECCNQ